MKHSNLLVGSFSEWSYLEVSNGVSNYRFTIDTKLVDHILSYHWGLRKRASGGKFDLFCNALSLSLHHFVLGGYGELFDACQVHHIDGGFVNCSRSNLVSVSATEHFLIHNASFGPLAMLAPRYRPSKSAVLFGLGVYRAGGLSAYLDLEHSGVGGVQ